jgi:hypothetical protein
MFRSLDDIVAEERQSPQDYDEEREDFDDVIEEEEPAPVVSKKRSVSRMSSSSERVLKGPVGQPPLKKKPIPIKGSDRVVDLTPRDSSFSSSASRRPKSDAFTTGLIDIKREEQDIRRSEHALKREQWEYEKTFSNDSLKTKEKEARKTAVMLKLVEQGKTPVEIEEYMKVLFD